MELFAKIVNGIQLLTIFSKISFLDVSQGSQCFEGRHFRESENLQNLVEFARIYFRE